MIGTAEKVVGEHTVVGLTMTVKVINIGLHIVGCEGFVVAVTLVDAVKTVTHGGILLSGGTPGKHQQREEYVGEFLHLRILLSFAKVVQIERNTKLIKFIFAMI